MGHWYGRGPREGRIFQVDVYHRICLALGFCAVLFCYILFPLLLCQGGLQSLEDLNFNSGLGLVLLGGGGRQNSLSVGETGSDSLRERRIASSVYDHDMKEKHHTSGEKLSIS
jgi:hypothetical protein